MSGVCRRAARPGRGGPVLLAGRWWWWWWCGLSRAAERGAGQAEHSGQWDDSCGRARGDHCHTAASSTDVTLQPLALGLPPGTLDNPALARCWNTPTPPPSRHTHTEDEQGLPPRPLLRQAASVVTATNNKHKLRPPSPSSPPPPPPPRAPPPAATATLAHAPSAGSPHSRGHAHPAPSRPHTCNAVFPRHLLKTDPNRRTQRPDQRAAPCIKGHLDPDAAKTITHSTARRHLSPSFLLLPSVRQETQLWKLQPVIGGSFFTPFSESFPPFRSLPCKH